MCFVPSIQLGTACELRKKKREKKRGKEREREGGRAREREREEKGCECWIVLEDDKIRGSPLWAESLVVTPNLRDTVTRRFSNAVIRTGMTLAPALASWQCGRVELLLASSVLGSILGESLCVQNSLHRQNDCNWEACRKPSQVPKVRLKVKLFYF